MGKMRQTGLGCDSAIAFIGSSVRMFRKQGRLGLIEEWHFKKDAHSWHLDHKQAR
jgi:hypothetical protein